MTETTMRSVDESLETIKANVEATLGVEVHSVEVDHLGSAVVRIENIAPVVWESCDDPTFGVSDALPHQVSVIDGRQDIRLPKHSIEIEFGQLFPAYCGPATR